MPQASRRIPPAWVSPVAVPSSAGFKAFRTTPQCSLRSFSLQLALLTPFTISGPPRHGPQINGLARVWPPAKSATLGVRRTYVCSKLAKKPFGRSALSSRRICPGRRAALPRPPLLVLSLFCGNPCPAWTFSQPPLQQAFQAQHLCPRHQSTLPRSSPPVPPPVSKSTAQSLLGGTNPSV